MGKITFKVCSLEYHNPKDKQVIGYCDKCGFPVFEGEVYQKIENGVLCNNCLI